MKNRFAFAFLILIAPLISAFWLGKYGSYLEAMQACVDWQQNGSTETVQVEKKKWDNLDERKKESSRRLKIMIAKNKSSKLSCMGEELCARYDPTEDVQERFIAHEMAEELITVDVVRYSRNCIHETETSQFLGIEGKLNVRKHFRY